jgi:hypothetical protein
VLLDLLLKTASNLADISSVDSGLDTVTKEAKFLIDTKQYIVFFFTERVNIAATLLTRNWEVRISTGKLTNLTKVFHDFFALRRQIL